MNQQRRQAGSSSAAPPHDEIDPEAQRIIDEINRFWDGYWDSPDIPFPEIKGWWDAIPASEALILRAALKVLIESGEQILVTVGNVKGGVTKTTTAVYLAMALALTGKRVLIIDGDATNVTVLKWKTLAGDDWPPNVQVLPWATPDLPRRIKAMEGQFDYLIVDTSPSHLDLLESALACTTTFLVTTQPHLMDVQQLVLSMNAAVKIDQISPGGVAPVILLGRAKKNTLMFRQAIDEFDRQEWGYLGVALGDRIEHAGAYGNWPWMWEEYAPVIAEFIAYELGYEDGIPGVPRPRLRAGDD